MGLGSDILCLKVSGPGYDPANELYFNRVLDF